jgi:hypothetical protein
MVPRALLGAVDHSLEIFVPMSLFSQFHKGGSMSFLLYQLYLLIYFTLQLDSGFLGVHNTPPGS